MIGTQRGDLSFDLLDVVHEDATFVIAKLTRSTSKADQPFSYAHVF